MLVVGGVFTVLWWLLRNKDAAQGRQIEILFLKHDEDANRLRDFQIEIASMHYKKPELDTKFDRLESAFRDGTRELGIKFDNLARELMQHNQGNGK